MRVFLSSGRMRNDDTLISEAAVGEEFAAVRGTRRGRATGIEPVTLSLEG
jgi:hypothetical protein